MVIAVMARTKTKKRAKTKKPPHDPLIRTDVWDLRANREQKMMMRLTVLEYRRYLMPLVLIINSQWVRLAKLSEKERINWVEKAIHQTAKNPSPRYSYYQKVINKYPSFRKFPSYLRRAVIAEALGIVSSFQTRYREWQSGIRSKRTAKPPRLTAMCQSYPALYKGQQIKYHDNFMGICQNTA